MKYRIDFISQAVRGIVILLLVSALTGSFFASLLVYFLYKYLLSGAWFDTWLTFVAVLSFLAFYAYVRLLWFVVSVADGLNAHPTVRRAQRRSVPVYRGDTFVSDVDAYN